MKAHTIEMIGRKNPTIENTFQERTARSTY